MCPSVEARSDSPSGLIDQLMERFLSRESHGSMSLSLAYFRLAIDRVGGVEHFRRQDIQPFLDAHKDSPGNMMVEITPTSIGILDSSI